MSASFSSEKAIPFGLVKPATPVDLTPRQSVIQRPELPPWNRYSEPRTQGIRHGLCRSADRKLRKPRSRISPSPANIPIRFRHILHRDVRIDSVQIIEIGIGGQSGGRPSRLFRTVSYTDVLRASSVGRCSFVAMTISETARFPKLSGFHHPASMVWSNPVYYRLILKIFSTSSGVSVVKPTSFPFAPQAFFAMSAKFLSSIPRSLKRLFKPSVS